jgi:hypothetical protein
MAAIRQGNVSAEGGKALTFLKKVFARFFQKGAGLLSSYLPASANYARCPRAVRRWILSLTF